MLNRGAVQLACIGVFLLAPALANAATRPWLSGSFGFSAYDMGDVNDQIGVINSNLAGTGFEMDEITKGLSYGLAFGLERAK